MQVPELEIRPAQSSDLAALLTLYQHLNPDDHSSARDEATREAWHAMLHQPGFTCFVGVADHRLAASCCLAIIPNLTRGGRPYALVENVVTHRDYRRRGFGRAVIAAWRAGCYKVMLLSGSRQPEVKRFYESCGFRTDDKTGYVARPVEHKAALAANLNGSDAPNGLVR